MEEVAKVLLTNSIQKPGPKEVSAWVVYTFAHQAYWGFKFLAQKRKRFWQQVLEARRISEIQEVGRACSWPRAMVTGYGAAGLMTWLGHTQVARQVLGAKKHRRFPASDRPSSQDRRMIFLSIAAAAGVWEISCSTALRKLAQAGIGIDHLAREVNAFSRLSEDMRRNADVWAEPMETYFYRSSNGDWLDIRDLPCPVPPNWHRGHIVHGFGPNGPESTFSPTLPTELVDTEALISKPSRRSRV